MMRIKQYLKETQSLRRMTVMDLDKNLQIQKRIVIDLVSKDIHKNWDTYLTDGFRVGSLASWQEVIDFEIGDRLAEMDDVELEEKTYDKVLRDMAKIAVGEMVSRKRIFRVKLSELKKQLTKI